MADIEIEIDGQTLKAAPNQTVIQVADAAGIYIPRFCYHKHLSIPANCRMCLVEVEKAPKTLPACATPCMPGMKIFTKSAKTLAAQRAVMEFLLINHPLDCPICDQGGECELQDLAMGYGSPFSHYDEDKRALPDQNLGPLIATDMTRCITCTRCVRFGDEIAGRKELGALGRGEATEISTYVAGAVQSEISGNMIDVCPVGALTSKPYRYRGRPWELKQHESISIHDSMGANLHVHTRNGKVMRVVARENNLANETWIADRDRFSYTGLDHADRLATPQIKVNGEWQTVSWQAALESAANILRAIVDSRGAAQIGGLISPTATFEEHYLLQKLLRGLGSENIDHRLRQIDPAGYSERHHQADLPMALAEFENCHTIFICGSNIQQEQPILTTRIRKAIKNGAKVFVLNPVAHQFDFAVHAQLIAAPHEAAAVMRNLLDHDADQPTSKTSRNHDDMDFVHHLLTHLKRQDKPGQGACILAGAHVLHYPQASHYIELLQAVANDTGAQLGLLEAGGNAYGARLAGAVPYALDDSKKPAGLAAYAMLQASLAAYVVVNAEADKDFANATLTKTALQNADCVIAIAQYDSASLRETATIILPMAAFTESAGTYFNLTGARQSVSGIAKPVGEARPAWKILRALATFLELPDFAFESADEVKHAGIHAIADAAAIPTAKKHQHAIGALQTFELLRVGEIPLYAVDSLVRRAEPLQKMQSIIFGEPNTLRLHPETAAALQLANGSQVTASQADAQAVFTVVFDDRIAKNCVYLPGGLPATAALGDLYGAIQLHPLTKTD